MKKIRVKVSKIKNDFYIKIPKVVSEKINLDNGKDLEITIHGDVKENQVELWDVHPEDINKISLIVKEDVHTMNMYNRIYIPEKYRFFFPLNGKNFILITSAGTIETNLSNNGYISKGLRFWFSMYGPLMPNDKIRINLIDDKNSEYQLIYKRHSK